MPDPPHMEDCHGRARDTMLNCIASLSFVSSHIALNHSVLDLIVSNRTALHMGELCHTHTHIQYVPSPGKQLWRIYNLSLEHWAQGGSTPWMGSHHAHTHTHTHLHRKVEEGAEGQGNSPRRPCNTA